MPVPSVSIQKQVGQTGSVGPSPVGVLAIIATAGAGPQNVPSGYSNDGQAFSDFGPGPLPEIFSYDLSVSGNQAVLVRPTNATAATYGSVDLTHWVTSTSTPTAGVTAPADWYDIIVTMLQTGAVGSAGLTYSFSLDGGLTTSAPQPIPTGTAPITITLPNFSRGGSPGASFSLSAGNVTAGDFFRVNTKPAQMNDTDLATSLEALRTTTLPWEAVLIDMDADASTIGLVDTWLAALEKVGKFKMAFLNTRFKNQLHLGNNTAETETAFQTAMTTLVASQTPSIRLSQGTDGGTITSTLTGVTQPRHANVFVAARAMEIPIGEEPAYVGRGALSGVRIVDPNTPGAPLFHNEEIYPNEDPLLLTTLRSVAGQNGAYVTNGLIFSQVGSDFALIPHARTMNRACEVAYQVLLQQLSRGLGKKPKDPVTGLVYIREDDAQVIEGLVNAALSTPLKNQVQAFLFHLSRTDDLSNQAGVTINSTLQIVSLAYVKQFKVIASFTKSLAVAA